MSTKRGSKPSLDTDKVVPDLQGIVASRVIGHYWNLPEHVRRWKDVQDFINECNVLVLRVLQRHGKRKVQFDPRKAKLQTWVFKVVDNHFRNLQKKYMAAKRFAFVDSIEEDQDFIDANSSALGAITVREAREAVMRLHSMASNDLLEFLDEKLFSVKDKRSVVLRGAVFAARRDEFRKLAKRTGVTIDHYRIVLAHEPIRKP